MSVALPPPLEPLAFLAGTWSGSGELHYPTIQTAHYTETVSFSCDGRPFFSYGQRTRLIEADRPAHAETGFWRHVGDGKVEVMLSHVTGLVEVLEGTVTNVDGVGVLELASVLIQGSSTAVDVQATTRRFEGDGTTLRYDMSMAAAGQPLTHHLAATFTRVPDAVETELAFTIRAEVAQPRPAGKTPDGTRLLIPILGGTFEGPTISGKILPGADRLVVRNDGVRFVDALYELEADDGTIITVKNAGPVNPGGTTRTSPRFVAPEGAHDWLNKSIFVGTLDAHVDDGYVLIRVDRVI